MPRHLTAIISCSTVILSLAATASAQEWRPVPVLMGRQAAAHSGRIHGLVRDENGRAIRGASIIALGATPLPVSAKTDTAGQFTLALPPGDYILRAARDGYVSTYREPVRIQGSTELERTITLIHAGASSMGRRVLTASAGGDASGETVDAPSDQTEASDSDHSHDEAAWRLRHVAPTALRDVGEVGSLSAVNSSAFRPRPTLVDWMMGESARAAVSFLTNTNFTGQVNFLTTSAMASTGSWLPSEVPHGVAYIALGAPVGSQGDWSVRGAMSATTQASWVMLGEYSAREDQPHAFTVGMSFGSQPSSVGNDLTVPVITGVNERVRSVGGMYGFDRWQVNPTLEIDYGLRFDRYDYVVGSDFVSPDVGFRLHVLPTTQVTLLASDRAIAPGGDEFLPPAAAGPWLPPERTFAPLLPDGTLQAERVRNLEVGFEQQLGSSKNAPRIGFKRFEESSQDQVVTLFGLDSASDAGHYYVASPGSLRADGWIVNASGTFLPNVSGSIEYTTSQSAWMPGVDAAAIAAVAPSAVRDGRERLHDVTTSVNATIPETSTRIIFAYRVNTAYSAGSAAVSSPMLKGRFNAEFRQALPVHPTRGSRTELIVVVRNLFRDPGDAGSIYDELLTVAPPLRIMGGVQVRF